MRQRVEVSPPSPGFRVRTPTDAWCSSPIGRYPEPPGVLVLIQRQLPHRGHRFDATHHSFLCWPNLAAAIILYVCFSLGLGLTCRLLFLFGLLDFRIRFWLDMSFATARASSSVGRRQQEIASSSRHSPSCSQCSFQGQLKSKCYTKNTIAGPTSWKIIYSSFFKGWGYVRINNFAGKLIVENRKQLD